MRCRNIFTTFAARLLAAKTISLASFLSGIARGCGWQHIGAYVNLGAFYLFGIPVAVALGFVFRVGGKGLWIGIVSGSIVQTTLLAIITCCTNWQRQVSSSFYHLHGLHISKHIYVMILVLYRLGKCFSCAKLPKACKCKRNAVAYDMR